MVTTLNVALVNYNYKTYFIECERLFSYLQIMQQKQTNKQTVVSSGNAKLDAAFRWLGFFPRSSVTLNEKLIELCGAKWTKSHENLKGNNHFSTNGIEEIKRKN